LIDNWQLADGHHQLTEIFSGKIHDMVVEQGKAAIGVSLAPLESQVFRLTAR